MPLKLSDIISYADEVEELMKLIESETYKGSMGKSSAVSIRSHCRSIKALVKSITENLQPKKKGIF
jgi:hypothetical protein